ncbi:hypothetical protein MVEN_00354800 [Mycena venus]|uniref:F-box domain-containing protein n=1 Tax=Mycena venus TaxID=2733690 RepID=A0A8H6YPG6_9AGAR|nr:hypothetical protein MVEN_00354800 [Mycena venus]
MSLVDSPFLDRLNTNYVPSDSEILDIRLLLMDPADELARLDAQIEEMDITLSLLKEKRTSLKAPIDAHRALISPMRHVPLDVLQEVFLSCLPFEHNALIDPTEAPLLLGRICRHWRRVAYSTPMLWSSIYILSLNYGHTSPSLLSKLERLVEAWLERSATCPLSVSLFDTTSIFEFNKDHPLILSLLPISRRICDLALSGNAQFFLPLLQLGSEDLPLLKRIRIQSTANSIIDNHLEAANVFQIPTLEEVALHLIESVDPLSLPLRWSQLTALNLGCDRAWTGNSQGGGLDFDGALDVLRRCPNLRRCELRITKIPEDPGLTRAPDTSPIMLPQMHTLVFLGLLHFQKWPSHLVVPKLCCLQLGYADIGDTACVRGEYIRADIDPTHFTSSSFRELLQSFPMMSHLRLSSSICSYGPSITPNDELLTLLHDLCPMLTHFAVLPGAGISEAAFSALVKARMTMPIPLQQVQLHFRWPLDPEVDITPDLRPFVADGLQIDIQYAPQASNGNFFPREGLYKPVSLY